MGKASRKKRQKESQAEPISKDKPSEAEETSAKWSLFNKPLLHLLLITIIGFLIYSNTFNVPFHFDDTNNIVENYKLKDLSNFWPPAGSRWFGFLTFALNYHFGGLNTVGYHIVNLIIHILNAILIYWLVALTFKTPYFKVAVVSVSVGNQPNQFNLSTFQPFNYLPLFIALIFVSHPIQTQAVTYIVQRFASLATMFYLLSLVMYIKARLNLVAEVEVKAKVKFFSTSTSTLTFYFLSVISAVLAMKTKEISFTLPFIIILYEFCFFKSQNYELRTMNLRRLLYLLPFLLTLFIIPLSIVGIDKPIGDAIGELREAAQETEEIPRWDYLFTQFRVIITYIRLLFLPINQNLDYDHPIYNSFLSPNVFLSFLFLLSIFGLGVYLLYRSRHTTHNLQNSNSEPQMLSIPTRYTLHATRLIAFGIFWFFITLSVESSIIPIVDVIFEHRLYLPSVGVFIAITTSVFILASKLKRKWPQIEKTVTPILALIIIILSIVTYARNIVWQDKMSLWEDVIKKSPEKARGHYNLGLAYHDQGRLDEAIQAYHIALRLKPDYVEAYNNLGVGYVKQGRLAEAIQAFQAALRLKPDFVEAYNNLGLVYHDQGRLDEAIQAFQTALRLKPDFVEAHYNLGLAYYYQGRLDEAIQAYHIALRLKPDYVEAHNNLGLVYHDQGRLDEAIQAYHIALRLKPDFVEAHYNLGLAYHDQGRLDEAIQAYHIALRLKPDYVEAYNNLGVGYVKQGRLDEAIQAFQTALRLKPDYVEAYNNLRLAIQEKHRRVRQTIER